jgi:hypothetical protein
MNHQEHIAISEPEIDGPNAYGIEQNGRRGLNHLWPVRPHYPLLDRMLDHFMFRFDEMGPDQKIFLPGNPVYHLVSRTGKRTILMAWIGVRGSGHTRKQGISQPTHLPGLVRA